MRSLLAIILFSGFVINLNALKCKSDGGPKEEELKVVYMNCLKRQENRNSSDISGRSSWNRDDEDVQEDSRWNRRNGGVDYRGDQYGDYGRVNQRFDDYSNNYKSSTQPPRRFRRERRLDAKSAQRSQYNPNSSRKGSSNEDVYRRDDRNSSNRNNSRGDVKACVFHCFLDELQMTGDNSVPDRYLVTNVLTKNVKNEELKEFLQESIEECFQILYNENTQDKCEFSKNLIMCLSEKGRANCDDWKDEKRF